jgi:hypothetical protein
MASSVFVAEWPDGQITRMNVHGVLDLARAVRVSWHAYDSRLKGRASKNVVIRIARFLEQPEKVFNDIDVATFFAASDGAAAVHTSKGVRKNAKAK